MKQLVLLLIIVTTNVVACLPTDGQEIELVGTVIPSVYKTETKIVHYKALHLSGITCFDADNVFSDENQNIQDIQLVLAEDIKVEVGKKYRFKGDAYHWHTAHHFTKVLLNVTSAKKL